MLNPNLSPRCQLRADLYEDRVPNKIVIIGDRPGPGTPLTQKRVPFCCDKHSSGWLNKQLTIPEEDLRWLNAADENGVETPIELLKLMLPAKVVIALGENASKWLAKHWIKHKHVPHPQFWRRFHNSEPYWLLDLLDEYRS